MKKHIKFVGLHAHSVAGSPFDALGYPQDHMDFAYENGLDAFALTDHGNCNGLSYQVLHAKKMEKEGKNFKAIFGAEAYFHPSLKQWHLEYEKAQQDKKNKIKDEDLQGGAVVEDESETKRTIKRTLNRRHHLVLLAMNPEGLTNLFTLVSKSFEDGNYYRFPRMDYAMLAKHNKGLIATSACVEGTGLIDTNFGRIEIREAIDKIHSGERVFVLSWDEEGERAEFKEIVWGDLTRKKAKVIRLKLKNGKCLKLTEDHKVLTNLGWIEAGDLKNYKKIKVLSVS